MCSPEEHEFDIHPVRVWRALPPLDKIAIVAFVLFILLFGGVFIYFVNNAPFKLVSGG